MLQNKMIMLDCCLSTNYIKIVALAQITLDCGLSTITLRTNEQTNKQANNQTNKLSGDVTSRAAHRS